MAAVFTFENGKQICFDRTIYANGKYVFLKDYQLLDEERRAVRDQLTRANNQIDDLKEQIAKLEKTRSSWPDNAVEWREKCEKAEKQIKELEHELRKKDDSENDRLDFTEHDKVFEDKIAELENIINHKLGDWDEYGIPYKEILDMKSENQELKQRIAELENENKNLNIRIFQNEIEKEKKNQVAELKSKLESIRMRCHESAIDSFDSGMYVCLHIVTADELKTAKDENDEIKAVRKELRESKDYITQLKHDLEEINCNFIEYKRHAQDRIAELESDLEAKDVNDRTVELPFDALETANMLINATYKTEIPFLERQVDRDIYNINDLEQIAEHLLVYCKHNREDEE